jgi:hypothetical protein
MRHLLPTIAAFLVLPALCTSAVADTSHQSLIHVTISDGASSMNVSHLTDASCAVELGQRFRTKGHPCDSVSVLPPDLLLVVYRQDPDEPSLVVLIDHDASEAFIANSKGVPFDLICTVTELLEGHSVRLVSDEFLCEKASVSAQSK